MSYVNDCIFYYSIYMKCMEKENLQTKKADQWLPRARGGSKD